MQTTLWGAKCHESQTATDFSMNVKSSKDGIPDQQFGSRYILTFNAEWRLTLFEIHGMVDPKHSLDLLLDSHKSL